MVLLLAIIILPLQQYGSRNNVYDVHCRFPSARPPSDHKADGRQASPKLSGTFPNGRKGLPEVAYSIIHVPPTVGWLIDGHLLPFQSPRYPCDHSRRQCSPRNKCNCSCVLARTAHAPERDRLHKVSSSSVEHDGASYKTVASPSPSTHHYHTYILLLPVHRLCFARNSSDLKLCCSLSPAIGIDLL